MTRVAHLGGDVEEGRRAGVGEDDGRTSRDRLGETGLAEQLVIGLPWAGLWRSGRTVLKADGDGHGEDLLCRLVSKLSNVRKGRAMQEAGGGLDVSADKPTCNDDGRNANPGDPANLAQRLYARESKTDNGRDSDKGRTAGCMHRDSIEGDRDAQHG